MSGRKSTEVNSMLKRGKDARESGMGNYLSNLNLSKKILESNQPEIEKIYNQIHSQKIDIKSESKKEFPEESRQLQNQFEKIQKENTRIDYSGDVKDIAKRKDKIDKELKQADEEQDKIRERIKNKSWYCDKEYSDATKLVGVYQNIAKEKNELVNEYTRKAQKSNQMLVKYQNLEKQMEQYIRAEKELNEKTAAIVEMRTKAQEAREYIRDSFSKINMEQAEKFLKERYSELREEISSFQKMSDESVVKKISALAEKVSMFSNDLDNLFSEYLKRKEEVESEINANKSSLQTDKNYYFEPMDYSKNKDDSTKIAVLDYLLEYGDKGDLVAAVNEGIEKAEALFSEEKFDEAEKQAVLNIELIKQANEYAALLQEQLIENYYVTKDIGKVMIKMGFKTGAYMKDGHIKNGWKISASNPNGENIEFMVVDGDAGLKIDIDHKTSGDCPSKWSEIVSNLENEGIYIEKIKMENGAVVLDKREAKADDSYVNTESNERLMER